MKTQLATTLGALAPVAGIMLAASLLLGIAYNGSSPLGVRYTAAAKKTATLSPQSIPKTGYFNQTISIAFEDLPSANPAPVLGRPSPGNTLPNIAPTIAPAAKAAFPELTWAEAKPLVAASKVILVDARLASAYQAGHIPGAVSLPINFTDPEMAAFKSKYPPNSPLVVYCGSASCHMAHDLAQKLATFHGFTNVKVMPGGYVEYRQAEAQSAAAGKP